MSTSKYAGDTVERVRYYLESALLPSDDGMVESVIDTAGWTGHDSLYIVKAISDLVSASKREQLPLESFRQFAEFSRSITSLHNLQGISSEEVETIKQRILNMV